MRQTMLDSYVAWINWSFDHPWVFAVGVALLVASVILRRMAGPRHPWRRRR